LTIKHYQERIAEFPAVMDSKGKPLEACLMGLVSTTGRLQRFANHEDVDQGEATALAGETLWLLTAACNELGIDLESAAETHLRELAEIAKKFPQGPQ
jgi:hypothetical protein